jgi:hypothetical protein
MVDLLRTSLRMRAMGSRGQGRGVGPGVNVSFYEKTLGYLGTAQTVGPLPAGASEKVGFVFNTDQKPSEIFAVVDEDDKMVGQLNECKEDNNKTPLALVCVPEPE